MQGAENNNNELPCYALGKSDCHALAELEQLRAEVNFLKEQVRTDALTGLYNFRFYNEALSLEMERTRRGTQPLSMIMLDVDHFKSFNDKWGHEVGNLALIHIASLIKLAVRKLDFACRFGGEEFVILLPNTELRQAISVAQRLREMIATTPLLYKDLPPIVMTASLGVDQFSGRLSESADAFKHRVDAWLYKAKENGRNCVAYPEISTASLTESVTAEEKNALFNVLGDE